VGCAGLSGDPWAWCDGNPAYWEDRQSDTEYLVGTHVRVGVSPTDGGTVLQLFDGDWSQNLLMEHGGAAIQLSIWGYDPVGGTGYFGQSWCDATPGGGPQKRRWRHRRRQGLPHLEWALDRRLRPTRGLVAGRRE
jgi:hypothetical protein